jgi:hypothetical protein
MMPSLGVEKATSTSLLVQHFNTSIVNVDHQNVLDPGAAAMTRDDDAR